MGSPARVAEASQMTDNASSRPTGPRPLRNPVLSKPSVQFRKAPIEWSLRALEILLPVTSSAPTPDIAPIDTVQAEIWNAELKMPTDFAPAVSQEEPVSAPLTMPTDLIPGLVSEEPVELPLSLPACALPAPTRPPAARPLPASFQEIKRRIYDW